MLWWMDMDGTSVGEFKKEFLNENEVWTVSASQNSASCYHHRIDGELLSHLLAMCLLLRCCSCWG